LKGIAMINLDDVEHGISSCGFTGLKPYLGRYRGRDPFEGLATERIFSLARIALSVGMRGENG
jgi:hypothetical protein